MSENIKDNKGGATNIMMLIGALADYQKLKES